MSFDTHALTWLGSIFTYFAIKWYNNSPNFYYLLSKLYEGLIEQIGNRSEQLYSRISNEALDPRVFLREENPLIFHYDRIIETAEISRELGRP